MTISGDFNKKKTVEKYPGSHREISQSKAHLTTSKQPLHKNTEQRDCKTSVSRQLAPSASSSSESFDYYELTVQSSMEWSVPFGKIQAMVTWPHKDGSPRVSTKMRSLRISGQRQGRQPRLLFRSFPLVEKWRIT